MKSNRYLLDTHILLWWLTDDKKLSQEARAIISSPENYIFISTVSSWEMIIKSGINTDFKLENSVQDYFEKSGFTILSITLEHTYSLEKLPLLHKDPFDRMLIAQALSEGLNLISSDKKIHKYPQVTVLS